jgi:hypothetical protein
MNKLRQADYFHQSIGRFSVRQGYWHNIPDESKAVFRRRNTTLLASRNLAPEPASRGDEEGCKVGLDAAIPVSAELLNSINIHNQRAVAWSAIF